MSKKQAASLYAALLLGFIASLLSGCGTASVIALHGVYIASLPNGTNALLTFDRSGCDMDLNGTYDAPTKTVTGTRVATGMKYTLVGTTVRVSGGNLTSTGRMWMLLHGEDPDAKSGDVVLLTVGDNGQSLTQTTSNGSLVYIRQ